MKYLSLFLSLAFVVIGFIRFSEGREIIGGLFIVAGIGGAIFKIIEMNKEKDE